MDQRLSHLRLPWDQTFPPKPTFSIDDIPDLTGKLCIVTGGYTGIETVRVLLSKNAKVYIAGSSNTKAKNAIDDLKQGIGKEAFFLELDLANLRSVKKAAEDFTRYI